MFRALYVAHRWLGIAGGLMVCVWYLSGLGLHWRAIPNVLSPPEIRRTQGAPFGPPQAARSFSDVLTGLTEPARDIRLRRAGARLVYEVRSAGGQVHVVDAQTGESVLPVDETLAREIAETLLPDAPVDSTVLLADPDTYSTNLRPPFYRVTFGDPDRTRVYVGAATASVLASAGTKERLYFLFVNKPHYLNFNFGLLRRHPGVIDAALLSLNGLVLLLVASGIILVSWKIMASGFLGGVGVRDLFVRKWHYVLGLMFSATTLGWVGSAFFLVLQDNNVPQLGIRPLETEVANVLRPLDPGHALLPIASLDLPRTPVDAARLSSVTLKRILDVPVYTLQDSEGRQHAMRADTGEPFTTGRGWLAHVASAFVGREVTISDVRYMEDYDEYYYARNDRFPPLPVYRVTVDNDDQTLLYLSAATGEVVGRASRAFRVKRWLVIGPHTWDWPFLLRRPLLWHAVSVTLITGGLGVTLTGLYLGLQATVGARRRRLGSMPHQQRRAS